MLILFATSQGTLDWKGRPLGTDFSNVYAAGTYVLEGQPAAPFEPAKQFAREQAIFGTATQFYGWHYPPFFLALAALLAVGSTSGYDTASGVLLAARALLDREEG